VSSCDATRQAAALTVPGCDAPSLTIVYCRMAIVTTVTWVNDAAGVSATAGVSLVFNATSFF
jgi:hypothetical protein